MNKLIFAIALVFILAMLSVAGQNVPSADAVMAKASREASATKKKVLVIFHASWCGWCRKMDTSIADPDCKQLFSRNFVITHLTVKESKDKKALENPGADSVFTKYARGQEGIPMWVIFDANGKPLTTAIMPNGENSGCPATEAEVQYFIGELKKFTDLNDAELRTIYARFRKNDVSRQLQ